jgi:hypothetical protein
MATVALSLGLSCASKAAVTPPLATCADASRLVCTGIYGPATGAGKNRIAPGIEAYEPGFRLWSDGLEKARYVYLPPGARINTADMNEWTFPVGSRFWKEFRWNGRPIETRFLEKTGPDLWRRTTFVWNADGSDAREATAGRTITLEAHGPYDIPRPDDCGRCHDGRRDNVLGFEALALAAPDATGLTVARLMAAGRLTRAPEPAATAVPGTPLDRSALGWLHMNCGVSCHNASPAAGASFVGLDLKLAANGATDPRQTAALRTALGRTTTALGFRDPTAPRIRIVPGRPDESAIYVRAASRAPTLSMPPLATHLVDREALAMLDRWIVTLAAADEAAKRPPAGRSPEGLP